MSEVLKKKAKSSDIALKVEHVSKSFRLPTEKANGIKQAFINRMHGKTGYTKQEVLKDISFEINKGDFFGIVGRNGSGKSTLLKLISQIYTPDSGKITVNGSLVPFIELGVGFNPELTGRENVYLNGAMLGFSKEEVEAMYDEIVEFAELHDFMDQKLKNYSSGMQVRLAFSVAIKAQADILVLDEVLAVGDEAFQRKCFAYFAELKKEKKTVILVTHSMDAVQQFCTKALMLEKGEILMEGNPAKVSQKYRELFMDSPGVTIKENNTDGNDNIEVSARNEIDHEKKNIKFNIDILPKIDITDPVITFEIIRDNGESVYRWVTDEKIKEKINLVKNEKMSLELELDNIFPNGIFEVQVGVKKRDRSKDYILLPDATNFEIINRGSFSGDTRWKPGERVDIDYDDREG